MARVVLAVVVAALSGCVTATTAFTGAAKVPQGPDGCRARCDSWGMQLAGMVQLGEYSDGCICEVKRGAGTSSASAAIPSAAGVHMQMVAEAQRQQNWPEPLPPPPPIDIPPPPPPLPW
jgi:hypothetical protein